MATLKQAMLQTQFATVKDLQSSTTFQNQSRTMCQRRTLNSVMFVERAWTVRTRVFASRLRAVPPVAEAQQPVL